MRRLALPAALGLVHGVADAAAGLLLGSLLHSLALPQAGALVLLYNALGFGCQPVAGLLADRSERPKSAAAMGLLLLGGGLITSSWQPALAVVLAGLGSAFFHVGGGALAVCATRNRAAGPGFFAAPGVVGLAIGGALAFTGHVVIWPFEVLLVASCLGVFMLRTPVSLDVDSRDAPNLDDFGVVMLLLLTAIALRSVVWSGFQFVLQGQVGALVLLALAACVGKMFGGIAADRVGWRRWVVGALGIATPLLVAGAQHLFALLIGVALLQSATPIALAATARLLPRRPATASGLALGLAIAAGGVPAYSGLASAMIAPPFVAVTMAATAFALWRVLKPEKREAAPSFALRFR